MPCKLLTCKCYAVAMTPRRSPRFAQVTRRRRKHRSRAERAPICKASRGVVRIPVVVKEVFQGLGRVGDFNHELRSDYRTLFVYNENAYTQTDKLQNYPGGGNAIIRPFRPSGRAIGVPTGFDNGFRSLDEQDPQFGSARTMIDEAIGEIVEHVAANPNRFDAIKFSANHDGKLGTGIFSIDEQVREYITMRLMTLPKLIDRRLHKMRFGWAATSPLTPPAPCPLPAPSLLNALDLAA